MLLLNNISEFGFEKLKKDRELVISEIKQLQVLLDQINLAFPYLSSVFDPEISVRYSNYRKYYFCYCEINHPNEFSKKRITASLGKESEYNNINDPKLLIDAEIKIKGKIKKLYPEMFAE